MRRAPAARPLVALLLAAALVACGSPAPEAGPTSTPAIVATLVEASATPSAGATSSAETVAATGATQGSTAFATARASPATRTPVVGMPEVLPAPIYLRDSGQVLRLERDAANYRQISFEQLPVVELAVPAEAGGIFYLTGDPSSDERTLVSLSGAGRRDLLYGKLSSLAVSPDGRQIFVRIDDPEPGLIIGQDEAPAGVWATGPEGGRPGLVIADAPADGVYDDAAPAWRYIPSGGSPAGASVAIFAVAEDGQAIPVGELVLIGAEGEPVRGPTCCEEPAWSADGTALYTAGGGPGPDVRYGLYKSDAATGAGTPVIEAVPDRPVPLVTAPRQLADGQLYAFVELAPAQNFGWEYPFRPALARVGEDGTVTQLAPPVLAPYEVLWSADGDGALLVAPAPDGQSDNQLYWQPADGRAATRIPFAGGDLAWVPASGSLAHSPRVGQRLAGR
ncbi:MAG: peptidoglycan-binding protein [Chloroflexales bacterium]|nr:peptidoglycan-binding protein [Chloroflexales bacterium]